MKLLIIFCLLKLTLALPQWPYRDNQEYYGYQRGNLRSVEDDDEIEVPKLRQDSKVGGVGGGQQPALASPPPVQVVETGSAKPVLVENNKQAIAPETKVAQAVSPPAFPPATPPNAATPPKPPTPPTEEDSEEDSEEEAEENDAEDEDEDDSDSDDSNRRRSSLNNATTMEALVPGYVTEQGEVLVPFDTVVGDKNKVVAVLEDPNYVDNKPPVVVVPSDESENGNIPKFFNPSNKQIYYSDVPPPGSIFTFDGDNEIDSFPSERRFKSSERRFRRESSEEAEEDEEDDEDSVEELRPERPNLAYVKATGPSGEDDEADSLGIRLRMEQMRRNNQFYASRSPHLIHQGNGFYAVSYGQRPTNYGNRPQQSRPNYAYSPYSPEQEEQQQIYYYRPASPEKVRVTPIGSFDLSLEEDGESVRPVVSPFHYYKKKKVMKRRPTRVQVVNRNRPTPVVYQRLGEKKQKQRREAKQIKKVKNLKKVDVLKGGKKLVKV